jgi:sortase (surface protein transpeptidase)
MDIPPNTVDTAWYAPGPAPGQPGDAVIDGHLNWFTTNCAVFCLLHTLRVGDTITVMEQDGSSVSFVVMESKAYGAGKPPAGLFAKTGPVTLSLITCAGNWSGTSYSQRWVVTAIPLSAHFSAHPAAA